jgi:hypothetical protein
VYLFSWKFGGIRFNFLNGDSLGVKSKGFIMFIFVIRL